MTTEQVIFLSILLLLHLAAAMWTIRLINKTSLFTLTQKRLNILLVMVLPFIWSVLIYYILKKEPSSYEYPVKNDISSNGFHESGKGIFWPH